MAEQPPAGKPPGTVPRGSGSRDPGADAALGAGLARADRLAFEALHARLAGPMRGMFVRRGAPLSTAEELCQQTWAAVWESAAAGRYDPTRSSPATYIYAVAMKVWLQHLRARGRAGAEIDPVPEAPGADPLEARALAEAVTAVRDAMETQGELSETDRQVLRLSAQGATDRELARHLSVSPSTAHAAKQGAYERLRRLLSRAGIWSGFPERPEDSRE